MDERRFEAAAEALERVVARDPKDVQSFVRLGLARHELRRYDEALKAFREAVRVDSASKDAWYGVAHTCLSEVDPIFCTRSIFAF
jgi:cytochrome c-type biogenesis protein CcmH/NrfG